MCTCSIIQTGILERADFKVEIKYRTNKLKTFRDAANTLDIVGLVGACRKMGGG